MPIYVYETMPSEPGRKPLRFEISQSMLDAPLTAHPETGEPVRRVITGGLEIPRGSAASKPAPSGGCCGGGGCGCH